MPLFATSWYWLPKLGEAWRKLPGLVSSQLGQSCQSLVLEAVLTLLSAGHELAFNIGMAGWVLRLALYTVGRVGWGGGGWGGGGVGGESSAMNPAAHVQHGKLWVQGQRGSDTDTPLPCLAPPLPVPPQLLPLFPSVWCILPVELLQGLTFAVCESRR